MFNCSIQAISGNAFSKMVRLESLYLSDNELEIIKNETLSEQRNLIKLYLNNNRLSRIEPGALSTLELLEILGLSYEILKKKSRKSSMHLYEELSKDLSFNNLEHLNHVNVAPLGRLKFLKLNNNRLKVVLLLTKIN